LRAILAFTEAPRQDLKTVNISSGGAFLLTDQALAEGSEVFMSLIMAATPDEQDRKEIAIKVKGKVKRRDNYGMAVGFDKRYCFDFELL
jgi:c-di-GMP-binding flagellar brake protein YcgR